MEKGRFYIFCFVLLGLLLAACDRPTPIAQAPTASATPRPSSTATAARTPTRTPTSMLRPSRLPDGLIPATSTPIRSPGPTGTLSGLEMLMQLAGLQTVTSTPRPTPRPTATPVPSFPAPEVSRFGKGGAGGLAFSPDGRWLAVGSNKGVYLYNAQTLQLDRFIQAPKNSYEVSDIFYSLDGLSVYAIGSGGIWVWNFNQDECCGTWLAEPYSYGWLVGAAFDPSSGRIALEGDVGNRFTEIGIWLLDPLSEKGESAFVQWTEIVYSGLAFSPDGQVIAAGSNDNTIWLWDVASQAEMGRLEGHSGDVLDLAYSPDGRWLYSIGADASLRVWEPVSRRLVQTIRGFTSLPDDIVLSQDGSLLIVSTDSGQVRLWQVSGEQLVETESAALASANLQSMAISPDGRSLALVDADERIILWNIASRRVQAEVLDHAWEIYSLAVSPDGRLAAAGSTGYIRVFELSSGRFLHRLEGHTDEVRRLAFSPDGRTLASAASGDEGQVFLWDAQAGRLLDRLEMTGQATALAFSPSGRLLAAASDEQVILWHPLTGQRLHVIPIDEAGLGLAFAPREDVLVVVTVERVLRIDLRNGQILSSFVVPGGPYDVYWYGMPTLALSPDGAWLLVTGYEEEEATLELWDTQTGRLIYHAQHPTEIEAGSLAFSADGRLLLIGGYNEVSLYDIAAGRQLASYPELGLIPMYIAFTDSGQVVLAGEFEPKITVWDLSALLQVVALSPAATATPASTSRPTPSPTPYSLPGLPPLPLPTLSGQAIAPGNARQVGALARLGKGAVHSFTWSPDGQNMALATDLGIYVYDTATWQERLHLPRGENLTFSPNGQTLAASLGDDVYLWEASSGALLAVMAVSAEDIDDLAFTPNGQQLLVKPEDQPFQLWDVSSGEMVAQFDRATASYDFLALDPTGQFLFIRDWYRVLTVDLKSGLILDTLGGQEGMARVASYSWDGRWLATGQYNGTTIVWERLSSQVVVTLHILPLGEEWDEDDYLYSIQSLSFSPSGRVLAAASYDGTLRLWNLASGELLAEMPNTGLQAAFSPDGRWLAAVDDQALRLWPVGSDGLPGEARTLDTFLAPASSLAFGPDGQTVVWGGPNGFTFWDVQAVRQGSAAQLLRSLELPNTASAYSPDGRWLACGVAGGQIELLEAASGENLLTLEGHPDAYSYRVIPRTSMLVFTIDGSKLLSAGTDSAFKIWDADSGLLLFSTLASTLTITMHPADLFAVVSSGLLEGVAAQLLSLQTGNVMASYPDLTDPFAFSPDGLWLVARDPFGKLLALNLQTGQQTFLLDEGGGEVTSLAFSPDGRLLAVGWADGSLELRQAADGQLLASLARHVGAVNYLVFSQDGSLLASAGEDGTVFLWGYGGE